MSREYPVIDTIEALEEEIARVKAAQAIYASYTQEQVDAIFLAAATAANKARIPLAKAAVAETGMGIVEDKVIKNHFASEYIYNAYRNTKTCGVNEPHFHRYFQNAACAENPQRHHHQPPPPRQEQHCRGCQGRAGGRCRRWRARGHHRLDQRPVA